MFQNQHIAKFKPYPLVSHKAWEEKDKNKILKLDWNESTQDPSPFVKKKVLELLENGNLNWYPDVNNKKLMNSIAEYVGCEMANVQYFGSSDSLHEYFAEAFIGDGEKVLIVSPTYDNFRAVVEAAGADVDYFELSKEFELHFNDLNLHIKKTCPKAVYICNPNNPTGSVYEPKDLLFLISSNPESLFLIDEAYYEFGGKSLSPYVEEYSNIFISRTFSKAFALAGYRIGYGVSSQVLLEQVSKVRNPKNINIFAQVAAIAALEDLNYMKSYAKEVLIAKSNFKKQMEEAGFKVFGSGGNFLMIETNEVNKQSLIKYLAQEGIYIRNLEHIANLKNYIRITIGTLEEMNYVSEKVMKYLNYEK